MAQISSPEKLLEYKLGLALGAERKVKTMLGMMEGKAQMGELKQGFARHLEETEGQIRNLEQALESIGGDSTAHRDPIVEGIAEHAESMLDKVGDELADVILVGGAADTEHHEIAMYESLITVATGLGVEDVVPLLQENLEQEQRTLQEIERATNTLVSGLPRVTA